MKKSMEESALEYNNLGEIVVYQSEDGLTHVDVRFEGDTVWLTQTQLVELYHSSKSNISEQIKHIFEDGELNKDSVVRKFRTVQTWKPFMRLKERQKQEPAGIRRGERHDQL